MQTSPCGACQKRPKDKGCGINRTNCQEWNNFERDNAEKLNMQHRAKEANNFIQDVVYQKRAKAGFKVKKRLAYSGMA